jgi:prolipoprotein diacylglyceryltransferase
LFIPSPLDPSKGHWATEKELEQNPALAAIAAEQRSAPVHAAQLYSTLAAGLVCLTLVLYFTLRPTPGTVFALMMILEGAARFTLETLRVEPAVTRVFGYSWSFSMVLGAILFMGGVLFWVILAFTRRPGRPAPCVDAPV